SGPSNQVQAIVPPNSVPPPPPTGLSITNITASISGNTETITASWDEASGNETNAQLWINGRLTGSGNCLTPSCSQTWTVPQGPNVATWISVSDGWGDHASQKVVP